ncbi:hypothetical protein ACRE1S_05085 [Helicobacter himalayensis]|uniref:hypothetical protein n=1 Tax=Helicobacter himalayensis TaxID=1591088 RepID=UPI003D6DD90F
MFFNILQQKPIFAGYNPLAGRFYPLAFMDLNLLMQFSSSPLVYFAFNALEFCIMACALYYLASRFFSPLGSLGACLIVFANVGFITIISGICFPERNQMLFLILFMVCIWHIFGNNTESRHSTYMLCFLFAFLSLFFKETNFIAIFTFSGLFLLLALLQKQKLSKRQTALLIMLILASLGFVLFYLLYILPQITQSYTTNHKVSGITYTKEFVNVFLNHPFVFVFLPLLLLWRIKDFLKTKTFYPLYDACILSALSLGASYFVLGLFSVYYFMPCYCLGFLGALYFLKNFQSKGLKISFILALILHLCVNLPLSLSTYTHTKLFPPHYANAMEFLANYTKEQTHTNIYLLGQNRNPDGMMFYGFMKRFLLHFGARDFDLLTNKDNPQSVSSIADSTSSYTIFNSLEVHTPKNGDLLYLDFNTREYVDDEFIANLKNRYTLIYEVQYFGFYNFNVKALIKFLTLQTESYKKYQNINDRISNNIFGAPNAIYIFKVP